MSEKDFQREQEALEGIRKDYEALKFKEPSGEERRRFSRYRATLPVRFFDKEVEARVFTADIGCGGLRISHPEPLDDTKEYEFKIFIGASDVPVSIKGRVVWQRFVPSEGHYEIGVFFSKVSDQDRAILQGILARRSGTEAPADADRRRFLRVPKLLFATVEFEQQAREMISGLIVDLSTGGIRLLSARQIPSGALLSLNIELEEEQVLKIRGRVVWGNRVEALKKFQHGIEFIYGIEFAGYSAGVQAIIDEYLEFRGRQEEANLVETLLRLGKEGRFPPV